jgi:hypothetical protein
VEFLSSCGLLYSQLRQIEHELTPEQRIEQRQHIQASHSALLLLCTTKTADLADRLGQRVQRTSPASTPIDHEAIITLVRQLTERLRTELRIDILSRP